MNLRLQRLEALVAIYAPDRAERLMALASPSPDDVRAAATLARCPRAERLAALATAFPAVGAGADRAPEQGHPLWLRLSLEARRSRSGSSTRRPAVRSADGGCSTRRTILLHGVALRGGTPRELPSPR